jgi:acetoin utilization deacetylase AcuC-like enzyme
MKTGFLSHELFMWHCTGDSAGVMPYGNPVQPGLPFENAETKRRMRNLLEVSGLLNSLQKLEVQDATESQILSYHTERHLAHVKALSDGDGGDAGGFSICGRGSYEIAMKAVGSIIKAADSVLDGEVKNAYALIRPPGHHAIADSAMGFCLFANAALAGKHLLEQRGLEKIAYVDWDVHHGNGTQDAFYDDPRALTISIHQDCCFPPDSGHVHENGAAEGEGYNINIPLPAGCGVGAYELAFDQVVIPALKKFQPQFIIVPCGFDAGAHDPLGRMMMHSEGYRSLTKKLMSVADECCGGKLLMTHEGGYEGNSVPFFGLAVLEELSGIRTDVNDPFMDIFAGLAGADVQRHQRDVIDVAALLIDNIA